MAWENRKNTHCNKSSTVFQKSVVALCSRNCVCNPSWPNHMLWEHRLISAIFSVHQLLQRCNLILPSETPVATAARTSAILKWLWWKNQMRDSLGCIHHGYFRFPDATGTCNHSPAGVRLVVSSAPQLCVLHRLGLFSTLHHTPHTWFHCMYSAHPPCMVSHLLARHRLLTQESILLAAVPLSKVWEAKKWDAISMFF